MAAAGDETATEIIDVTFVMARFLRRLFVLSSAASLLLMLGISILWIRSYRVTDRFTFRSSIGHENLYSRQGHLVFYLLRADWPDQPAKLFGLAYQRDEPSPPSEDILTRLLLCTDSGATETSWDYGAFYWWERRRPDGVIYLMTIAPCWSLTLASSLLPLFWTGLQVHSRLRRRLNRTLGLCRVCGYDLRATPQRCPECGSATVP
jgi:hypothetical protein